MEIKSIIAVAIVIIGIIFLVLGVREKYIDNSDKYQSTAAEIYDVRIETQYIGGLNVRQSDTEYQLHNQYKYKVGNLDFTGEFIASKVPTMEAAKNEKDRIIKAKNKFTIYYLKSDPKQSGLTIKNNNSVFYFVLTAVCLIIGLTLYFVTYNNNDQTNKVKIRTYNFD